MNKAKVLALSLIIAIMAMYMPACAQEAEAGDFTGILTVADDQKIIVSNAKDTKEFVTDDLTQYDMSGESSFCMNDIVLVKYHSKGKTLVADSMTLKKHVHEDPVFSGTVTGLDDKSVTVTSNSLTITFSIDDGTAVDGNLRMGDTVKVSYIGDLSEFPKAAEIKVTKEVPEEPQTLTASGIISEFTDSSLLLSLDSAHSKKFTIDKNTKITGVAKTLKVGDSVNVTFNNTGGDAPLATEINIVKETAPQTRTINGTVKSVGSNALTVITDEKSYTFTTDENTKYKGVKPAVGYKAEVTYTESNGKNIASVVYCRKTDEKGITASGTVLSWGNGLAAISIDGKGNTILEYTDNLEKASGYTPQVNDYVQITYIKSTDELSRIELIYRPAPPKPTPEEPTAASGVIASWGDGKCTITVNGTAMNFTYTKDLDISKGYKPQAKDEVDISYTKSDSVLRKIVLTNRPQPPSPVIIKTEGTLTAWGINGQNRCTVATAGNGTLELSYDPASLKIPTGYMPQADDNVKITYTESDMVLKEIALLSRPDHKVTAEATIKAWGIDGMNMCSVGIQGSGELILTYDPSDLDIPAGYYPQTDDYVSITYTSNDKVLRAISLISRPEKPEPAPEPEPTPEPEPAPEPEPEPTPVLISAQDVTIVSGDEDSRTCTVRLSSGDSIELRFDGDTDVAAGYFPQAGDTVDITYDMDNMLLKSIRLKDRPAPADDANDRDNADDGDDASDASDESQETQ